MTWLYSKIAMIGGAVLAFGLFALTMFRKGKKSAFQEVAAETHETVVKVTKNAKQIREDVDRISGDDARDELRKQRDRYQ